MITFLLDSLSLEIYSETFGEYLPELFLHIVASLTDHCDTLNACQITISLKLCLKILSKITLPTMLTHDRLTHNRDTADKDMVASSDDQLASIEKLSSSVSSGIESSCETDLSCPSEAKFCEDELNVNNNESGCGNVLNFLFVSRPKGWELCTLFMVNYVTISKVNSKVCEH